MVMQTFVPYDDIDEIAKCLDYRRLGKQRVEASQILDCLYGIGSLTWKHHPAVKMWKGYESFLSLYRNTMIKEWIRRGYKNTLPFFPVCSPIKPSWWGGIIHSTHRSALLYKDQRYYAQFEWREEPVLAYFWPTGANHEKNK